MKQKNYGFFIPLLKTYIHVQYRRMITHRASESVNCISKWH